MKKIIIIGVLIVMMTTLSISQLQLNNYGRVTLETSKSISIVHRPDLLNYQSDKNADEMMLSFDVTRRGETLPLVYPVSKDPVVAKGQLQEVIDALEAIEDRMTEKEEKQQPENEEVEMDIIMKEKIWVE